MGHFCERPGPGSVGDTVGHSPWLQGDTEAPVGKQAVFTFTTHRPLESLNDPEQVCMEGT